MKWTLLGAGAWLTLSACTPSQVAHDFARHADCAEERVQTTELEGTLFGSTKYRASGCGKGALFYCRGSDECASPQITVANRHARQFGCGASYVSVQYLDGGAWKASGCDRELTYHCFEHPELILRCIAETSEEGAEARRRVAQ